MMFGVTMVESWQEMLKLWQDTGLEEPCEDGLPVPGLCPSWDSFPSA